jgi:hypothetical protein
MRNILFIAQAWSTCLSGKLDTELFWGALNYAWTLDHNFEEAKSIIKRRKEFDLRDN